MFYLTTHSTYFIYGYMAWDSIKKVYIYIKSSNVNVNMFIVHQTHFRICFGGVGWVFAD